MRRRCSSPRTALFLLSDVMPPPPEGAARAPAGWAVPALRVLTTPYRVGRAQETFYGTPRARAPWGAAFWLVVAGVWAAGSYRLMAAPTIGREILACA